MTIYLWVTAGVEISELPPLIRALPPRPPLQLWGLPSWERVRPCVARALFSLEVALLVVAAMGSQRDTWSKALIADCLSDSTLQKATTGNIALAG